MWVEDNVMVCRNQRIHFKIRDVYHPDPAQVLKELHGDDLLIGTIIDFSDSGMQVDAFVVVEVDGLEEPVIVPTERIFSAS
jgi:hypothetical protein